MEERPQFQKNVFFYENKKAWATAIFQTDTRTESLHVH